MKDWVNQIHVGDCVKIMKAMVADGVRVQSVITSPPYWGLRQYGHSKQHGLEPTPQAHIRRMTRVFGHVRDLMRKDGTLWLNYGDSYASSGGSGKQGYSDNRKNRRVPDRPAGKPLMRAGHGFKAKDLYGLAWRIAFALQEDGYWLRAPIIWQKSNPMPESAKDRPTMAHEYIFLMAKAKRYFYDCEAVREPASPDSHARRARARSETHHPPGQHPQGGELAARPQKPVSGWATGSKSHSTLDHAQERETVKSDLRDVTKFKKQDGHGRRHVGFNDRWEEKVKGERMDDYLNELSDTRHMRTVWSFPTESFKGAHFATFPRELVERCIAAGSKPGDIIFDPYAGSGTVCEVATSMGRRYIGIEINQRYVDMFKRYRSTQMGLAL